MTDTKRPLKVFLCHAHADRDSVRGLYTRLTQDGVDAWLDKAKLLPGQDWELEIRKAVREADVVVVCLSKQFNQAGFRQKEVRLALDTAMEKPEGEIFIIPARLEECDNLESLRKWHWVDLFEDDGYEMLMRALRTRANKIDATLQINSVARENKQREAAEKVERERVAKEVREKREREAAEKAIKEKTEKDFQREVDNRFKKVKRELQLESYRTKIHHWLSRVRIYALPNTLFLIGIIFAISMAVYYSKNIPILNQILNGTPQPTPENTQTQAKDIFPQGNVEPSATATPKLSSLPASTLTPTSLPAESIIAHANVFDIPLKLYFVSADKYLYSLDVQSGKMQKITMFDSYDQYSTLFWIDNSKLANWSPDGLQIINITSDEVVSIDQSDQVLGLSSSDISDSGEIVIGNHRSWENPLMLFVTINDEGSLSSLSGLGIDMNGYRAPFCMRWQPNDSMVALIIDELDEPPGLAILRPGPNEKPVVIRKRVDGCISWSPDGKYIAFGNGKIRSSAHWDAVGVIFQQGIYYIDYLSGSLNKITDTNGYHPTWSPYGDVIAFITETGISLVDLKTKNEQQIYSGDVVSLLWQTWTP